MATRTGSPSVSSWQGEGNEVRRGAERRGVRAGAPRRRRDHCADGRKPRAGLCRPRPGSRWQPQQSRGDAPPHRPPRLCRRGSGHRVQGRGLQRGGRRAAVRRGNGIHVGGTCLPGSSSRGPPGGDGSRRHAGRRNLGRDRGNPEGMGERQRDDQHHHAELRRHLPRELAGARPAERPGLAPGTDGPAPARGVPARPSSGHAASCRPGPGGCRGAPLRRPAAEHFVGIPRPRGGTEHPGGAGVRHQGHARGRLGAGDQRNACRPGGVRAKRPACSTA